MKKFLAALLFVAFLGTTIFAQDGSKAMKEAQRALAAFNLDQINNVAKLSEAVTKIDMAIKDTEVANSAQAQVLRGDIYSAYMTRYFMGKSQPNLFSNEGLKVDMNAAYKGALAYIKAYELAEAMGKKGKRDKKDVLKGMQVIQQNLSNAGIINFTEVQDFESSFVNFRELLNIHDILKKEGQSSVLDDEEAYHEQLYLTGLAAMNAGQTSDAMKHFNKLYEMKYEKPAIYEAMYKIAAENEGLEQAARYLDEGRKLFPDDVSLLFAEINHYLAIQKLDVLITKLEKAIEAEPTNTSLYLTTGSVYDNLYQIAVKDGDEEQAQNYFDKSLSYYNQTLERDPKSSDAVYSIGALYYNRAATMTQTLNEMSEDYSKEGIKRYNALKEKMDAQFGEALPYFERAYKMNPKDVNTLIALKEIAARQGRLEDSNRYKEELEALQKNN